MVLAKTVLFIVQGLTRLAIHFFGMILLPIVVQTNIYIYEIIIVYRRCHPDHRVGDRGFCLFGSRLNPRFAGDSHHSCIISLNPSVNNVIVLN